MGRPELVIVSNRGPLSFRLGPDGEPVPRRGGGGLVSSLGPAVAGTGALWVAAALSDADRVAAARGVVEAEGFRLHPLVVEPPAYRQYYDTIANGTLWFLHHGLFDLPRRPRIDRRWHEAWATFRDVNRAFAEVVAGEAGEGATVLVHDYHLPLVAPALAALRPDLETVYFHHTPFCGPTSLRVLPEPVAAELLGGMAASSACGFHSARWARAFEACAVEVLGASLPTFVAPAAVDGADLATAVGSPECDRHLGELEGQVGDRRLVVRVDRIELSKNILRGFLAFEALLEAEPAWREQVVFAASLYPSRDSLPEYLAYRNEVEALVARINDTWSTPSWTPILLDAADSFPASLAALRRYDVLLVNPVRDGLNLVALEGPSVNQRDGVLVLSREAGACEVVGDWALAVNPYDVAGTAGALGRALAMGAGERAARAAGLRAAARRRTPVDWLGEQLAAVRDGSPSGGPRGG
ncbi:MAG TPA: trehalose-6-phosphate synthase [Acidimicrobiales bacterium]|nr:trehalose-6-phosphate synthase [Acidimicrobiales bacterium]